MRIFIYEWLFRQAMTWMLGLRHYSQLTDFSVGLLTEHADRIYALYNIGWRTKHKQSKALTMWQSWITHHNHLPPVQNPSATMLPNRSLPSLRLSEWVLDAQHVYIFYKACKSHFQQRTAQGKLSQWWNSNSNAIPVRSLLPEGMLGPFSLPINQLQSKNHLFRAACCFVSDQWMYIEDIIYVFTHLSSPAPWFQQSIFWIFFPASHLPLFPPVSFSKLIYRHQQGKKA